MAVVTEVVLTIGDRANDEGRWDIGVAYSIEFDAWERGAWFEEEIALHGFAGADDTVLATLTGPPFVASDAASGSGSFVAKRQSPRFLLDAMTLDVRRGHAEMNAADVHLPPRVDKILARVDVAPLSPTRGEGRSDVVARKFGVTS